MANPRYRRRKEDRPREITEAAFATFAEKGYSDTRIDDVAKRAGVSKGLTYLYFKTKEELFKAVIKSVVVPRIEALAAESVEPGRSAEAFIRGPLAGFMKKLPRSPVAVVVRLMIAEGYRHPELVEFYWQNVLQRGLGFFSELVARGVKNGEFRSSAVTELPQLFIAPTMFAVIWSLVFKDKPLDSDRLIETNIEVLLEHLKAERK